MLKAYQTEGHLKAGNKRYSSVKRGARDYSEDSMNRSIRVANLNHDSRNSRNNSEKMETDTVFGNHAQGSAGNNFSLSSTLD